MGCCSCYTQRYMVALLGFVGMLVSVGFRACFALVMTHVTGEFGSNDEINFLQCTVVGTEHDWRVNWTQSRVFLFHTVYFMGSMVTQVPGGLLAARFSAKHLCGVTILLSSLLFIVLPFLAKQSYIFVFIIRTLQGLLEGPSVPAAASVVSAWGPKRERTRLLTITYAGAYLSPAVGFFVTGVTVCRVSWDSVFFIYGGLGVLWFILWTALVYDTPEACPRGCMTERERVLLRQERPVVTRGNQAVMKAIPWRKILTSVPVFAVFVGAFCRNYVFSMLITAQPQYFRDAFTMDSAEIGLMSAIPSILMTVVVICGGFLFDCIIHRQYLSRTCARKLAQSIGFGVEAVCLICLFFVTSWQGAVTLFCVGVGLSGFAISGYQANPLDLSPQYAGLLTGLGRVGTIGSIISTAVAAAYSQHSARHWRELFLAAGVIHLAGVVLYDVLASGNLQPWDPATSVSYSVGDNSSGKDSSVQLPPPKETDPLLRVDRELVGVGFDRWDSFVQG